jgi:hypothetical protein
MLLVVEVEVRRAGESPSSCGFLPRAAFQAAEPVLSTRSLKFLRASSSPQRLRGMVGVSGQNILTTPQFKIFKRKRKEIAQQV